MVAAAFLASFVVFGVIYSFGVFLKPMAAEFDTNATAASAFFSITAAVYYSSGAVTGRLADRFEPRIIVAIGALASVRPLPYRFGRQRLALLSDLWHRGWYRWRLLLPAAAGDHRQVVRATPNTALGIAAAGTGCGTMVLPPLAAALIQHYGWRRTNIIFGIGAGIVLLGCAVAVASPPIARSADGTGRAAQGHLWLTCIRAALHFVGAGDDGAVRALRISPAFARDHGASEVAAAALVSAIGGASISAGWSWARSVTGSGCFRCSN